MALPKSKVTNAFVRPDNQALRSIAEQAVPGTSQLVPELQERLRGAQGAILDTGISPMEEALQREVPNLNIPEQEIPTDETAFEGVDPSVIAGQQQIESQLAPKPISSVMDETGRLIPSNIKERIAQTRALEAEGKIVTKASLSSRETEAPAYELFEDTDVGVLEERREALFDDFQTDVFITSDNRKLPAGNLAVAVAGPNTDMNQFAIALDIGMIDEINSLNQMGLEQQNFAEEDTSLFREGYSSSFFDPLNYNKGTRESESIGQVKARLIAEDDNDLIETDQYAFINNTATRMVKRAMDLVGAEASIDPDDRSFSELGEYLIQRAIDRGDIGLYSFTQGETGKKYYYLQIESGKQNLSRLTSIVSEAVNPNKLYVRIGSPVPTSYRGDLDPGYSLTKDRNSVLLKDGSKVSLSEAVLSQNGGVGRLVDDEIFIIVEALMQQEDMKYFKLDESAQKETYQKAYEKKFAKEIAAGTQENIAAERASIAAQRIADRSFKTALTKARSDLMLLKSRLDDKTPDGQQKMKFAEWGISQINNRIQEISRDMQSDSKAVIRAADSFAEKAKIKKASTSNSKEQADKLKNIIRVGEYRSRNGMKALEMFSKLPASEQQEMSAKAMWAGTFIKLMQESQDPGLPPYVYLKGMSPLAPNTKRMTPYDLLTYYADNEKLIMDKLGSWGSEVNGWVKDPTKLPVSDARTPWQKEVLSRGELGYYISNLLDAYRYNQAPDGTVLTLKGMYEIDANNSNVAIKALKTGNLKAASTLGFAVGDQQSPEWYDTMQNPDSFYRILSNNLPNVISKAFNDSDKAIALNNFVQAIVKSGKEKDLTRDSVVAGFYGLHPKVNVNSVRKLLRTFEGPATTHLINNGPYNSSREAIEDLLSVLGYNFDEVLGNISTSKTLKQLGSVIAINGNYNPEIETDIGDIIKAQVAELMPEELKDMAYEVVTNGKLKARPTYATYVDHKGVTQPSLVSRNRIDDSSRRFTIDADGKLKDISKHPGARFADSIDAVTTHTQDAALEKIAITAANSFRSVPLPNISIHDANKLNAVSFINHWIAYNMVAVPSLLKQETSYNKIYQVAGKTIEELREKVKRRKKKGQNINVGTKSSKHRALFNIFDYHLEYSKSKTDDLYKQMKGTKQYENKEANRKYIMQELLPIASANGWVPKDPSSAQYKKFQEEGKDPMEYRANAQVTPEQFEKLLDVALKLQGFLDREGKLGNAPIAKTLSRWNKAQKNMIAEVDQGRYTSNTQN